MMNVIMLEPIDGVLRADIGNYIVYSDGRVWGKYRNRFMKPSVGARGYLRTVINGKSKTIHRLIAETFIPNPENLHSVDHINNNKTDNRVENLRWCTTQENLRWAWEDELVPIGKDHGRCKLKESEVIEIYENSNRLSQKDLAEQFGVSRVNISTIQSGKTWAHITGHKKASDESEA